MMNLMSGTLLNKLQVLLILVLSISLYFPIFPTIFGSSPVHLVLINIILAVGLYLGHGTKKVSNLFSISVLYCGFYFLLLVVLLIARIMNGTFELVMLSSIWKPLYILLFVFVGASLSLSQYDFDLCIDRFFKIALVISLLFSTYELIYFPDSDFINYFYKREEREVLIGKSTTWFGVTYYQGFYFLLIYTYFLVKLFDSNSGALCGVFALGSAVLVIVSQSRTMIASMCVASLLVLILCFSRRALIFSMLGVFFAAMLVIFSDYNLLNDRFRYVVSVYELVSENGVYGLLESGSFVVRVNQIVMAYLDQEFLIGAYNVNEVYRLESSYASYLYRFGLIFGVSALCVYVYIGFRLLKCTGSLVKALGIFWIITPVSMFASPIVEFPRHSLLIFIMTGYFLFNKYSEINIKNIRHDFNHYL